MAKVAAFLAEGFEEVEALTVIDLLRRGNVEVTTVSIMGDKLVKGGHDIPVKADALFEDLNYDGFDMLFLPGGGPSRRRGLCLRRGDRPADPLAGTGAGCAGGVSQPL